MGFEVRCLDLDVEDPKKLLNLVAREKPFAIGFSIVTQSLYTATSLARAIREIDPSIPLIAGGPHPTLVPSDCEEVFDIVVVGEGEAALPIVIDILRRGKPRKTVVIRSRPIENLDSIPYPDRDSIDLSVYGDNRGAMMTSRGCPYSCLFCATRYIMGRKFRAMSANRVVEEWRIVRRRYGAPKIRIVDDVFTLDRRRAIDILTRVRDEGLGPWSLPNGVRADNIDEELAIHMAESGCTTVWFGVESGDPRVLKVLRKGVSLDRVEYAVKLCRELGMRVGLFFMVGAPGETLESTRMTIDFIQRLDPDYVHFSIATPYPNTEFWRWVEEHGRFLTKDYRYFEKVFIFETPDYPLEHRVRAVEMILNELGSRYDIDFDLDLIYSFLEKVKSLERR